MLRAFIVLLLAALLPACGSNPPTGPSEPAPSTSPAPPAEAHTAGVLVFLDWDRDGAMSGAERALAGVEVEVAQKKAVTDAAGRAAVAGVPRGTFLVQFGLPTLPAFLTPLRDTTVTAPAQSDTPVPLIYPIGANTPGLYMAFGDSISSGDGSTDRYGFRAKLGRKLTDYYRQPIGVDYGGNGGGRTEVGVDLIEGALKRVRPAFTLIQFGVNDWANGACAPDRCDAIPNLRQIIRSVKAANSLPVVATLTPSNTGFDQRSPAARNEWVKGVNELIRTMAPQEGALLVDLYAAFEKTGRVSTYMTDHVHPNDAGYDLIAEAYFQALTQPRGTTR